MNHIVTYKSVLSEVKEGDRVKAAFTKRLIFSSLLEINFGVISPL